MRASLKSSYVARMSLPTFCPITEPLHLRSRGERASRSLLALNSADWNTQPASRLWVIATFVSVFALAVFFSSIALAGGPADQAPCDEAAPPDGPAPESTPWLDPALAPEERTELLLAQMTIGEKVDMATGELCGRYGFFNLAIPRVGIPALTMADGPAGVRINNTETNEGRATALPAPIALAATWDVSLARTFGDVLGNEAFLTGHNVLLGPAVDMARAPLAGRV